MTKKLWARIGLWILIGGTVFALTLVACSTDIYRDCGYICQNTGSRKGCREWFFGMQTGNWRKQSALETFMQERYPNELQLNWISYMGTGRNIFGEAVSHRHGSPGPLICFPEDWLDGYVRISDSRENKALYDLLATGNEDAINAKLDQVSRKMMAKTQ
jgi:hypothetical protein